MWMAPVNLPPGYTLKARAFTSEGVPLGEVVVREAPPAPGPRTPSTLVPVTQNRDFRIYDWADRHAAAAALMKSRQPEIVMLGDSITHFWGGDPVGGRRTGVDEWDRFFSGRRVVNLGYGWDRTENVLWRLTHGEFDDVSPKVVVVMIGTNNIKLNTPDEIAAGIGAICAELHRRSAATRILLLGIFPRATRASGAGARVERSRAAGSGRRRTAMQLGADGGNAGGDLIRCVELDVVRANHHHDDLRAHIVEFAVRQPPEHVLSAVPSVAEVDDATAREEPVPLVHAGSPAADGVAAPEMRDRVASITISGWRLFINATAAA